MICNNNANQRALAIKIQTSPNFHQIRHLMLLMILLAIALPALSQNYQALDALEEKIKKYANEQLTSRFKGAAFSVQVKPLDKRLKFPQCAKNKLILTSPYHKPLEQTKVVSVECQSPHYWSIYVPLDLSVSKPAVVSRSPILPGQTITAQDVEVRQVNILKLNYPTFSETESVIGKLAKGHIRRGQVVRPNGLKLAKLIEKGEIVTLVAVDQAIRVSTKAIAMGPGRLGERINVKNLNSNKVIAGKVVGKRQVEVRIGQ